MTVRAGDEAASAAGKPQGTQLDQELNMESEGQLVTLRTAGPLPERSVLAADTFRKLEEQAASERTKS